VKLEKAVLQDEKRGISLQFLAAEQRATGAEEQTAKIRSEQQTLQARLDALHGTLAESEKQLLEAKEEVGVLAAQVEEPPECGICFEEYGDDNTRRAVLYPCGHLMCTDCAEELWNRADVADRLCHTCNQPLTSNPVQLFG
jgi:hypothetical protein